MALMSHLNQRQAPRFFCFLRWFSGGSPNVSPKFQEAAAEEVQTDVFSTNALLSAAERASAWKEAWPGTKIEGLTKEHLQK